jgi:hypothetical protein
MKKTLLILIISVFLLANSAQAKFPIHLGGFTLGDDVNNYKTVLNMESCRIVSFNQYLTECEINDHAAFKSGLITYGLCDKTDKILRIKLKFRDASKKFYNKLLKQYKKQLGEPTEYKGDPFQTLIAWKWSFKNEKNQRISLILQHNALVEDEKMGNAVKLTLIDQIEKERDCYLKNHPDETKPPAVKLSKKELWELYVPY